jgi:hypothetical protein
MPEGFMAGRDWRIFEAQIAATGKLAAERARAAGAAIYYTEPQHPEGVVKEYPDGSRELVELTQVGENIIRVISPRAAKP